MSSNATLLNSTDPLSLIYAALWDCLEANTALASLVRPGNRMKFLGTVRDPLKDKIGDADTPELRLIPTGLPQVTYRADSSNARFTQGLQIGLATGDQRVDYRLFPVQWEVMRALSAWPTFLDPLTWNGFTFGTGALVSVTDSPQGVVDADLSRNIVGWSALVNLTVMFAVPMTVLAPGYEP